MKQELKHTAQGLAALGRYGDSMLMHVSPQEVAGLQALGRAHGAHLTTNPHTGLPEAFSFGNFFKSLLPTVVGAVTAPFLGPYGAVLAGAATGAATNSQNPLMGAVMGGLGGYGGANIGSSLTSTGGAEISKGAADAATNSAAQVASDIGTPGASVTGIPLAPENQALVQSAGQSGAANYLASTPTSNLGVMGRGITALGNSSGRDAFVNAMGGASKTAYGVGAPLAMAGLSGIEPPAIPKEDDAYDPNAKLNLDYSSGLRLLAEGGDITEMPDPGSNPIQDAQEAQQFGLGGLAYAGGGDVQKFAGGGKPGLFGGSSLNLNAPVAAEPNRFGFINGFPNSASMGGFPNNYFALANPSIAKLFNYNMSGRAAQPVQAPPPPPGPFAQSGKPLFAKGGFLDGPGDGMSDSIPATIGDKQPARLADGEFVVPADVVSHLGNGSTKAGAQRLYSMMDKVRKARTGTEKQGKQIKPEKYMPA
jgi:hypothetical protein